MSGLSVILLGNSAVGKSSSGNTILGRNAFRSRFSPKPVTTTISEQSETVHGRRLSVVDTPGILINQDAQQSVRLKCEQLLRKPEPTVFLVVLKVDRVSSEQVQALEKTMEVLGEEGMKRSLLLFTYGNALEGRAVEDFIYEDDEGALPDIYSMFGQRHHVFDNAAWGQEQVHQLLHKISQLQTEVYAAGARLALGPLLPHRLKEVRQVLLGLPGAGKSSSGNSILRLDHFKSSCGFNAVSTVAECMSNEVLGRHVSVVDTPGFSDEGLKPKQLFKRIMKSVLQLSRGPHAFIIVVRVGRVMRREAKLLELIPRLFDKVASKFTMVLFTHGDDLGGENIEKLIEDNSTMRALVAKCDQRYTVFNNKSRATHQIAQLFKMIDTMVKVSGEDHCNSRIFKLPAEEIKEFLEKTWNEIKHLFTNTLIMSENPDDEVPLRNLEATSLNTDQE